MHTSLISLRELTLSDSRRMAQLANNKKVWDNLRDSFPYPYYEKHAIEFIHSLNQNKAQWHLGIEYKEELCGVIGLFIQQHFFQKKAELGYWLGEDYWHQGIATEAVRQICQYGFDQLGLKEIYASVFDFNKASMAVLKKNDFQKVPLKKRLVVKNGQSCLELHFAKRI